MDKKHKQHRQKTPTPEELNDGAPPGASFNTEEGRAAHGMRKDIGGDPAEPPEKHDQQEEPEKDET